MRATLTLRLWNLFVLVFAFSCWKVFIDPGEPEGSSGVFFHFTQFLWPSSLCFSFTLYSRGPGRSWLLLQAINMFITHTLVQVSIDLLIVFWQSSKYARHRNTLKTLLSQILWRNKPFYCRNQFIWIHDTVLFAASSFSNLNLSDAFSSLYFWGVMSPFSQHYQVFKVSVLMSICSSLSSSVTWPPPCWRATVVL